MARGKAAFEVAKNESDFQDAVAEFRLAAALAPWWGAVYFDLGSALEKSGDFAGAKKNLNFYLLSQPSPEEVEATKSLIYELEYKQERKDQGNGPLKSTEGVPHFEGRWENRIDGRVLKDYVVLERASFGKVVWGRSCCVGDATEIKIDGRRLLIHSQSGYWLYNFDLILSADENQLRGTFTRRLPTEAPQTSSMTLYRQSAGEEEQEGRANDERSYDNPARPQDSTELNERLRGNWRKKGQQLPWHLEFRVQEGLLLVTTVWDKTIRYKDGTVEYPAGDRRYVRKFRLSGLTFTDASSQEGGEISADFNTITMHRPHIFRDDPVVVYESYERD